MPERIVIIGAGQSGAQAVATLRAEGFAGDLTLVGDEPFAPYQRPPLSKAYLMGTMERDRLFLKPEAFYTEAHCKMLLGVSATAIDRTAKTVKLSDGQTLTYDKLLIATGSRVRTIKCAGSDLAGIHYLRGIADVDALRAVFAPGAKLAIVGGGYIGLEVAAVAAKRGIEVTVFEALDRLMARAVSPPVSAFYENVHRAAGVKVLLNTGVEAFEGDGKLQSIRAAGQSHAADVALVGIGIVPNVDLAREAPSPATRRFSRPATAQGTSAGKASPCVSNACRMPSIKPSMQRSRCSENRTSIAKCRGSGPINMISNFKSQASPARRISSSSAAIPTRASLPSFTCAMARSRPSRR
jgi:3-phenylpropionate/trans-cinnamate dioxygenase ferredoxin reductase subunit